jgi:predicted TIM-barrel fold metal-dependent hydrolase
MTALNDAHCHFFSTPFYAALGGDAALARLGWDPPGTAESLAGRWVAELDRHGVARAALIATMPGDAASVATAVRLHPDRFVGFFMVDPTQPDAAVRAAEAIDRGGMRAICLYPAMHRYSIQGDRAKAILEVAAAKPGTAVFVHCGVLSVGVRKKLGLPSPFDIRFGNPLDLHAIALSHPQMPIIIPHFGAGLFREALMAADAAPNIVLDTSSSNSWIKFTPGLTLRAVFARALDCVGADRLMFGTDSSFFPRGWHAAVFERQQAVLADLGVGEADRQLVFGGNFLRVFDGARAGVVETSGHVKGAVG